MSAPEGEVLSRPVPFVIFALPRSRTAWLAHFLSYGEARVGHDIAIECKTVGDFLGSFANGMTGTVETGAMMGWRLIREALPGVKFLTIRRPLAEVQVSLARFGIFPLPGELETREALLDTIAAQPGTHQLTFSDLDSPHICSWLFEHCLGVPFDLSHWARLQALNIQVNMGERLTQLARNYKDLERLKADILVQNTKLAEPWLGLQ